MEENKKTPQVAGTTSEDSQFIGVDFDFSKTINEHRVENGLKPLDDPSANVHLKPLVK